MKEKYLNRIAVIMYQDNNNVELAIWITELRTTLEGTGVSSQ